MVNAPQTMDAGVKCLGLGPISTAHWLHHLGQLIIFLKFWFSPL